MRWTVHQFVAIYQILAWILTILHPTKLFAKGFFCENGFWRLHTTVKTIVGLFLNASTFQWSSKVFRLRSSRSSGQLTAAGHVGQNSSAHVARSQAAILTLITFKWSQLRRIGEKVKLFWIHDRELFRGNTILLLHDNKAIFLAEKNISFSRISNNNHIITIITKYFENGMKDHW